MQKSFFNASLFLLAALLLSAVHIKATAIVDKSFGTNGTLNINVGANQIIEDIGVQTDGKIVVVGSLATAAGNTDIFLARYNPDGTPDQSFGTNGISKIALSNLNEFVYDFEFQIDGKIVAVGKQQATGAAEVYDFLVVRFNQNGSLDQSFGNNGIVTENQGQNDQFNKVAVQPDGKIVIVGETQVNNKLIGAIGRFNSDGTLDGGFEGGGFFIYEFDAPLTYIEYGLTDVEVLPDGSLLLGGEVEQLLPHNHIAAGFYEIKLPSNGNPDVNPGNDEISYTLGEFRRGFQRESYDAEVLPSGKIFKASGIGIYIDGKRFLQDGTNAVVLSNGRIAVAGERFGGNLKIYSETNLVGTAWNVPTGKLAAASDGKVLILSGNTITRVASITSQGTRLANFNKDFLGENSTQDNKTDFAFYRPGEKKIFILKSNGEIVERTTLGEPTKIFPEFTNFILGSIPDDGFTSNFFNQVLISWEAGNTPNQQAFFRFDRKSDDDLSRFKWGLNGDIPFGGDFDGNGSFDVGVFRPSDGIWYGFTEPSVEQQGTLVKWGTAGDKPVPADYDFDGITDRAVYRPSTGTWWILKSSGGSLGVKFGLETDIPLTGDFDADGRADFTVYRPSEGIWYQLLTTEGFRGIKFGIATDYPVPGDYDGDGRHDVAVFREGLWYLLQSTEGFKVVRWGTAGDVPITVRYDR